jgi:predicted dinucleotide-binding enzyme
MKIGIIGAGQIGGTLTRRLTALGHKVFVANSRGPETLSDLAAETGATAVSIPQAVRGVDLIVVTIPQKNIPNLPAGLFADTPDRVVVVDTGNYYPRQRDGRIEAIEAGLPESRWVEQQIGRPVIKAFNNIYARHLFELGRPAGAPGRIALPVAGDDHAAKTVVLKLVEELGFDGVDAGGLDESWRQQPGTPVYTKDFDADGRPLITVWLEVRILPGPPRSPMRTDVSRSLTNSPQFSGISAGSNAACAVSAAS